MEELDRSHFTRAGEIANERFIDAALDPELYPDGTAFIASDAPNFQSIFAENVAEHRPIAVIYPDGREFVASPQAGLIASFLAMLLDLLLARRERSKLRRGEPEVEEGESVPLPADYRVEIREREREPVG